MTLGTKHDLIAIASAALLAGAVAFAAMAVGNSALAALSAPLAFALAYAGVRQMDDEPRYRLAQFEIAAIDPLRDAAEVVVEGRMVIPLMSRGESANARCAGSRPHDAGRALSEALAQLKHAPR